jgi:hypothetical protein
MRLLFLILALLAATAPLSAAPVQYKEEFYKLYHLHYIQNPSNIMENIYWLERALWADFCNPLWALTKIENETQWEKYRTLFMMHINLKLIEQYIFLGNKYNKRHAYFFNAPWKAQNLESLKTAETCYRSALYYWDEALKYQKEQEDARFRYIDLEGVRFWQDEALRIGTGDLDYRQILERELASLEKVRAAFEAMK